MQFCKKSLIVGKKIVAFIKSAEMIIASSLFVLYKPELKTKLISTTVKHVIKTIC